MATSAIMGVKTTLDKKMQRSITNINPNAADGDIVNFVEGLNGLSTNTLTEVRRVDTTELLNDTRADRNLQFEDETTTKTIQGSTLSSNANEPTALEITGNGLSNDNIIVNRLVAANAQGYVYSDWSAYSDTNMSIFFLRDAQSEVPETTITITVPATDSYKEGKLTINITAAT